MPNEWGLVRKNIYKYPKSGKLIIAPISQPRAGAFIMELDNNFNYTGLRTVKRQPNVQLTPYVSDVLVKSSIIEDGKINAQFKLLRVLNKEEVDLKNWEPTKKLEELKVLPFQSLTKEEIHWAGKIEGNETEFYGWWIAFIGFISFVLYKGLFNAGLGTTWPIYFILIIWIYLIKDMRLTRSKKPSEKKIKQLSSYKQKLIKSGKARIKKQLTELDKALGKYSAWKNLSPINFEEALKMKLNKNGMKVDTTKTSGDGGIDLIGIDENKNQVLIQAKKYSKPVGVSVVREMIGVRQNHKLNPRTIIYSLEGFTKGAYDFAKDNDIELKSIRDDLIRK